MEIMVIEPPSSAPFPNAPVAAGFWQNHEASSAEEVLSWAIETFGGSLAISTSFQHEGMVILDMAARLSPDIRVFTLDTGRLPDETYQMMDTVRDRYGIAVEVVSPDPEELRAMVSEYGPNLFRQDVAQRLLCCHIRKTRPLERKLAQLDAYVVGLRRSQTRARGRVRKVDTTTTPVKISPLADWSKEQVDAYTRKHNVPTHPLYAQGYASIGCGPCTRAIVAGESERDGRWWWEQDNEKECGLHFSAGHEAQARADILITEILSARV
ncbi:MAG TPA: phosphoadenylyl-sulfate reductase [Bryobacteraceae bacterium]|nr:phosphoadenylyl-sulfate reductase [Bryobacteraceae bacterium]